MSSPTPPPYTPASLSPGRNNRLSQILHEHFWKGLALLALAVSAAFCMMLLTQFGDEDGNAITPSTAIQGRSDAASKLRYSLRHRQKGRAGVHVKGHERIVFGYISDANDEYVLLETVYKADAQEENRTEVALIPWENIDYIELTLKNEAE